MNQAGLQFISDLLTLRWLEPRHFTRYTTSEGRSYLAALRDGVYSDILEYRNGGYDDFCGHKIGLDSVVGACLEIAEEHHWDASLTEGAWLEREYDFRHVLSLWIPHKKITGVGPSPAHAAARALVLARAYGAEGWVFTWTHVNPMTEEVSEGSAAVPARNEAAAVEQFRHVWQGCTVDSMTYVHGRKGEPSEYV